MRTGFFVAWAGLAAFLAGGASAAVVEATPELGLAGARDRVRALRAAGERGPVEVRLAAGRYACRQALALDGRDANVTWRAADGAEVRISGGVLVTAAPTPVSEPALLDRLPAGARGKVVQFDLARLGVDDLGDYLYNYEDEVQRRVANTWNQGEFTQGSHPPPVGGTSAGRLELFVDDRPMTVARTPSNVVFHVDRLLGATGRVGPGGGTIASPEARFTIQEEIPAGWANEPDAHLCGCWCRDWAEQHQRIVKLDRATRAVELSKPWHQYRYRSGTEFFGFNMLCELDAPGEWYVDRARRLLLAWLPAGARRIELSVAGRLVELAGATNVVFRGVTFEACRNSAVRMKDCEDCRLESCTVRNVGHHALVVEDGHRCGARACQFHGMGGGGAFLVDGNRATLEASGHFAEFCDMHDFGRWNRMYRPGVCLAGVGMRAVGNRIHDAPHAAILFFGCELLMQSNEIFRVNRETKDCGAFYSGRSWMLRGNRILDNHFHDIVGLRGAYTRTVYLDDSMADTLIAGNRFERCTWAIFIGGSRENVITNNVFVDCPNALYVDARGRGWQRQHVEGRLRQMREKGLLDGIPYRTGVYAERYPALRNLPGDDPFSPVLNVIAHNVFDRGDATWIRRYGNPGLVSSPDWWHDCLSINELAMLGTVRNNVVDGQPLNMGAWYVGPSGGAFGDPANWADGVVPSGTDRALVPRDRTVVVGPNDLAALTNLATLALEEETSALELRDVDVDLLPGRVQLTGRGVLRAVGTGEKPRRLVLRQDNSNFGGSFFFTNVCVWVHGPKTLGRSCPVMFCKTTAGAGCTFNFAAPGVYSSDLLFLPPPRGAMWYAAAASGTGPVVNRGRLAIAPMLNKLCGRIQAGAPFVQEGLLDLGARIDLTGNVTLRCPVRFHGHDEELFTDDPSGVIRVADGFAWSAGADLADSVAYLLRPGVLGPWKKLVATSRDANFAARVKDRLPAEWRSACTARADGRAVEITWRDPTAPQ